MQSELKHMASEIHSEVSSLGHEQETQNYVVTETLHF